VPAHEHAHPELVVGAEVAVDVPHEDQPDQAAAGPVRQHLEAGPGDHLLRRRRGHREHRGDRLRGPHLDRHPHLAAEHLVNRHRTS
jgi:hypothetical protein